MRFRREKQEQQQPLQTEALERLLRSARDWEPDTDAPLGLAHRALAGKTGDEHAKSVRFVPLSWWRMGGTVGVSALAAASVLFVQLSSSVPLGTMPMPEDTETAVSTLAPTAPVSKPKETASAPEPIATKSAVSAVPTIAKMAAAKPAAQAFPRSRRSRTRSLRRANFEVRPMVAVRSGESSSGLSGAAGSEATGAEAGKDRETATKTNAKPMPVWNNVEVQRPMYGILAPAVLTATNEQGEIEEMPVIVDVALDSPPSFNNVTE